MNIPNKTNIVILKTKDGKEIVNAYINQIGTGTFKDGQKFIEFIVVTSKEESLNGKG